MLDHCGTSRDDLIGLILAQCEALAERDRRTAALEAEAAALTAAVVRVSTRAGELLALPEDGEAGPAGAEADPGA